MNADGTKRERYADLYHGASVGYCRLSAAGRILDANPAAAVLLDEAEGGWKRATFTRYIRPESKAAYELHRRLVFDSGLPQSCDLHLRTRMGADLWVHVEATLGRGARGGAVCHAVLMDITDHRLREEAQMLSSRLMLQIRAPGELEPCMAGLADALKQWVGCESVGIRLQRGEDYPYYQCRGFADDFIEAESSLCARGPDGKLLCDAAGRCVLECICGSVLREQTDARLPHFTEHGSFWTNHAPDLMTDSKSLPGGIRIRGRCLHAGYRSVALVPMRVQRRILGLLQFNDRRSNRFSLERVRLFEQMADSLAMALSHRQAEEALRANERRFRTLLQDIPGIAVQQYSPEGTIHYWNPASTRLYGYPEKEAVGRNLLELIIPPEIRLSVERMIRNMCKTGEPAPPGEYLLARKDGARVPVYSSHCVIQSPDRPCELFGVDVDLSSHRADERERRILEHRMEQLQKSESLGRMAGSVAHHFNNQLQAVMGNLEMAMDDYSQVEGLGGRLKDAMSAAHKAAEVSRLMLTYLGQSAGHAEAADLSELCRRILPRVQASMPIDMGVETELPSPGPMVVADEHQLQQVMTNLVKNASESMNGSPGRVRISIGTLDSGLIPEMLRYPADWQPDAPQYARLEVRDDGCGIDPDDIENIFDPFFSRKMTGRGLGLAVTLGIVRIHGGAVCVETIPGQGSAFQVFLPLVESAPCLSPGGPQPRAPVSRGKVLLVDDNELIRRVAAMMLGRMGFDVLVARDGVEAMDLFRSHQADTQLVLCDLSMPRMNGWETLTALRAFAPGLPVILSSGYDEAQVMTGHPPEQPQAFLHKPYRFDQLRDAITVALAESCPSVLEGPNHEPSGAGAGSAKAGTDR